MAEEAITPIAHECCGSSETVASCTTSSPDRRRRRRSVRPSSTRISAAIATYEVGVNPGQDCVSFEYLLEELSGPEMPQQGLQINPSTAVDPFEHRQRRYSRAPYLSASRFLAFQLGPIGAGEVAPSSKDPVDTFLNQGSLFQFDRASRLKEGRNQTTAFASAPAASSARLQLMTFGAPRRGLAPA
jgi:hypothetical protein